MTDAPRPDAAFTEYAAHIDVDPARNVSAALVANHLAFVGEVVGGVRTVLALAERNLIEDGNEDGQPILNQYHMGTLMRMAIRAIESVEQEISDVELHLKAEPSKRR